ncbi:MAG TPA: hypothetical protein VFI30_03055 [Nocardioidaceae bacterium]|nr:hypothetical protein [Nocardioidaceae bacterium]
MSRPAGGTLLVQGGAEPPAGRPPVVGSKPIGRWLFAGVCLASFGGPLALAAQLVPSALGDARQRAGLVVVLGAVGFLAALLGWLRYNQAVTSSGGLAAYAAAVGGRRLALVQAVPWLVSYVLYVVYTPVSIVYDVLPTAVPGIRGHQTVVELLLPAALAALMLAGRRIALSAIAVMAFGQVVLLVVLAVLMLRHAAPAAAFALPRDGAGAAGLGLGVGSVSLFFVCGSLPFFLGGEVAGSHTAARRIVRTWVVGAFLFAALGALAVVFPLTDNPAFLLDPMPGVTAARVLAGPAWGTAIGLGLAASTTAVILVEFLAITRVGSYLSGRSPATFARWLAVLLALAGPVSLLDPGRFYDLLETPSLVALWVSLLVVAAALPWLGRSRKRGDFRGRSNRRTGPSKRRRVGLDVGLAVAGSAYAGYGLYLACRAIGA